MTDRVYPHGHMIHHDGQIWRYSDDGHPLPERRAAVTHSRGGEVLDMFMVELTCASKNIDGSETRRIVFPKEITVLAGDKVSLTYYLEK